MKKLLFILMIGGFVVGCTSNEGASLEERRIDFAEFIDEPTTISFEEEVYNFGTVTDGDMVKHTFKFTNTGDKNLVLIDVTATCGCTVPEDWPKHPIAPGEGGEIKVVFNTNNRVGAARKSVRVEANTNPSVTAVTIEGEVVAAI
jgi:hypothetical protein